MSDNLRKAQILLVIPVAGIVALVLFEVIRTLLQTESNLSGIPPVEMLASLLSISALASILLHFNSPIARWLALAIAALMTLFHAAHIVEHGMAADHAVTALILVTMFLPSLLALLALWGARKNT